MKRNRHTRALRPSSMHDQPPQAGIRTASPVVRYVSLSRLIARPLMPKNCSICRSESPSWDIFSATSLISQEIWWWLPMKTMHEGTRQVKNKDKSTNASKKKDKFYFCSIESQISGYTWSPLSSNESGVVYRYENGCKQAFKSFKYKYIVIFVHLSLF